MSSPRARLSILALGLLGVCLIVGLVACGEDERKPGEALSFEGWKLRADAFCSDGIQEAVALPLPTSKRAVALDAAKMAEIVVTVRDAILSLGAPDGKGPQVGAYLEELAGDAALLLEISETAANRIDTSGLQSTLDESAGEAASELELEKCAGFANVVARTP